MKNFVEELRWRGMLAQIMPGTEELLQKEMVTAMLRHLQHCGHKPIILVGGATGMIGDPSGKSQERNLLNEETLRHNQECIKAQVAKFLDFESKEPNAAEMVNNYDWMKDFTFLDFAREVGKHITVNYMMETSQRSKPMMSLPASRMRLSRYISSSYSKPPGTGVPVLGQSFGSKASMSMER